MGSIRTCTALDVLRVPSLLEEYAVESGISGMPTPSAQFNTYLQLEQAGVLHVLGAYKEDMLVGFVTALISELPHYGAVVAITESFFVAKEHRAGGVGIKLLRAVERMAKQHNACGLLVSAPAQGNLSKVLPRVGYKHTNEVFFRSLA